MPRVLRIINRLNLGGPTFNASYLTRYLAPEYETLLVSGMKDDSEASSEFIPHSLGIEPRFVQHMQRELSPQKDYLAYRELRGIIREFKPDIVHTHAAKPGTVGRLAALHEGVPVVLHTFHGHVFHSYFGPGKTRVFLEIERYLARKSTGIIAISPSQKQELSRDFRITTDDRIHVVPLGFDLDRFRNEREQKRAAFRERYKLQPNDIAVGIVGRLVPVKQHGLFLKAFADAERRFRDHSQSQNPALNQNPAQSQDPAHSPASAQAQSHNRPGRLVAFLIGDGESRADVEAQCRENQLAFTAAHDDQPPLPAIDTPVVFTSWIQDVDRAFAGLDIIALSSLNEGTPVSLIEALAAGKPLVSTDVGGIRDILPPEFLPYLTEKTDHAGFADRLLALAVDAALRAKLGRTGEQEVFERFGYQRLVRDVAALYEQLLRTR